MTEQEFRDAASRDGYDAPTQVDWEAGLVNEDHTHEFSVRIFVLSGELKVVCSDRTSICHAGDNDALEAGIMHAEYVGTDGVKFLVARKTA